MSVVISSQFVLSDDATGGGGTITADNPIIGYENLVTTVNLSTTTEDADYPSSNMANNSTYLKWKGTATGGDEFITMVLNTEELVDYVAIAKHNFYSDQIVVSVEVLDSAVSPDWTEVISETLLPNDGPTIFRFTPQGIESIRIRLQPSGVEPECAVVYAGKLLVLQRRLYVGHTPMPYGRVTKVLNARSENGNFLGRVILNETTQTNIALTNLTPGWYRTYMEPFIIDAKENPFFFAWRPSSYPREAGYAWLTGDAQPVNQSPNGMMSINLALTGISGIGA